MYAGMSSESFWVTATGEVVGRTFCLQDALDIVCSLNYRVKWSDALEPVLVQRLEVVAPFTSTEKSYHSHMLYK